MELIEAIKTRTCVRSFLKKEVEDEKLNKILDAAVQAPSAKNLQSWEFIVVKEEGQKARLGDAAFRGGWYRAAPVLIVVCANLERVSPFRERGKSLYVIQDCAAAAQNILLAAHDLGLVACWVGSFKEEVASEVLELPGHIRPVTIIPLGYPAETPKKPERMKLGEVVHEEKF